jgi:hypothetical protein
MDLKDTDMFLTEEILNEKTTVSFHKKSVESIVASHKESLKAKNHTIIHHKNFKDGSHEILHQTPKGLRLTTVTQAQKRGVVSKVVNKPAPPAIRQKLAS